MSFVGRSALLVLFLCALALGLPACSGDPPDKEMQQAETAIETAKAAGADDYARDDINGAVDALKQAYDAVDARDYRLALGHAISSRERAQTAATQAVAGKAAAHDAATRAIATLTDAVAAAKQTELKAADVTSRPSKSPVSARATRSTPRRVAASRKAIATAEKHVQEARTALDHENFGAATTVASSALDELDKFLRGR